MSESLKATVQTLSEYLLEMVANELETLADREQIPTAECYDTILGVLAAKILAMALQSYESDVADALFADFEKQFRDALKAVRECEQ